MAGTMLPPEVLTRKSLFSLLYQIDQDLSERTRAKGCPFAGVRCIAPITSESLEVGPRILRRLLSFALACAAAAQAAGAVCCRHRFGFGIGGFTGRRYCCWSAPCAKNKTLPSPWSGSRGFAAYGVQRSNAGNATLKSFLSKPSAIGVCPVT